MGIGEILNHIRRCSDRRRSPRDEHILRSDSIKAEPGSSPRKSADKPDTWATLDERVAWIRAETAAEKPKPPAPTSEEVEAKRRKQADEIDRLFILKSWVDLENESARNAEPPKPPEGPGK